MKTLLILFLLLMPINMAQAQLKTEVTIKSEYKIEHDLLSDCYYKKKLYRGKILTKEQFDTIHGLLSLKMQKAMIDNGYEEATELLFEDYEPKIIGTKQKLTDINTKITEKENAITTYNLDD